MQLHGAVQGERPSQSSSAAGQLQINAQRNAPDGFSGGVIGGGDSGAPSFKLPSNIFNADGAPGPSSVDSVMVVRSADLKVRGYVPDGAALPLDAEVDGDLPPGRAADKVSFKT